MERRIALTFDDGQESHAGFVADELEARGLSATFYAADTQMETGPLSHAALRKLYERGFDIGWHGRRHDHLGFGRMTSDQLVADYKLSMETWCKAGIPRPWSVAPPGFHMAHIGVLSSLFGCIRCGRVLSQDQDEEYEQGFGLPFKDGEKVQHTFFVAGPRSDLSFVLDRLKPGETGIVCFHSIDECKRHLNVGREAFTDFLDEGATRGIQFCNMRDLAPGRDDYVDDVPWRIPEAVMRALRGRFKDRVVCDLGCSRGDAMLMIGKWARRVIGVDHNEAKIEVARARGLDVVHLDYLDDELPSADTYFSWPDDGPHDLPLLARRIKKLGATFCFNGDRGFQKEAENVKNLTRIYGGRTWSVHHNDGVEPRQRGFHQVGVIDYGDKKA